MTILGADVAKAVERHSFDVPALGRPGLFWLATPRGGPPSILFGYDRVAAIITPDIVNDGVRYVDRVQRLVIDTPNYRASPILLDALPPVFSRISQAVADRVRAVLDHILRGRSKTDRDKFSDKISGLAMATVLLGEGASPPRPSVGGVIFDHARAAGRPITFLISPDEIKSAYRTPDFAAIDRQIDEAALVFLLTLRDKVGPMGRYQESLYAGRRPAEVLKFDALLSQHVPALMRQFDFLPDLAKPLSERALQTIRTAQDSAFLMLFVGSLIRNGGILSMLQDSGIKISLLA